MFNNLRELVTSMPDEKSCREYLAKQRWPDGKAICPHCGCSKSYVIEGGKKYKCANSECYKKFSVIVGTVFEASNIPLTKWFMAIYLCTAHKKGISSYQLGRDIGVTQKTGWFMLHRIREIMKPNMNIVLGSKGIVEADETFVGGRIANHSRTKRAAFADHKDWKINKTTTFGMIERGGNLIMKTIPALHEERNLRQSVRDNLEYAATLVTDDAFHYKPLKDDYHHHTVHHGKNEFARLQFHTNTIEGVFSHFKRGIIGVFHQVSPWHLQRYLNEFTYKWNRRKMKDVERFGVILNNPQGRLTYKKLISGKLERHQGI